MTVTDTRPNPLQSVTAADAMRPGVITVPSRTTVREVAATMALRGIHAVLVTRGGEGGPSAAAAVSDLEVVRAALDGDPDRLTAGELPGGSLPVVDRAATLHEVATVMVDGATGHVLVAEADPFPGGVLSAFDLVAVLGGHDPRYARAVRPAPARPALSDGRLDRVTVRAAMHPGVVACPPSTAVVQLAGLLADHRIHCAAVSGVKRGDAGTERLVWALVDAMDVVAATLRWDPGRSAADMARGRPITVPWDETVAFAARSMVEDRVGHVVAVDSAGLPSGVLSTLDVAALVAIA